MCVARFDGLARARVAALGLAGLIAACAAKEPMTATVDAVTDGAAGAVDSGTQADGAKAACKHPTPPNDPCQERWCDNPAGVGMPCTGKGGECAANTGKVGKDDLAATICTATFTAGKEAYCTMPCVVDAQCFEGAVCTGDPKDPQGPRGCVLKTCAGDPKPSDAGSSGDGGPDVAATADTASPTDAK